MDIDTHIKSSIKKETFLILLSYFDSSFGVLPIVDKLSYNIQKKWATGASQYKLRNKCLPFSMWIWYKTKRKRLFFVVRFIKLMIIRILFALSKQRPVKNVENIWKTKDLIQMLSLDNTNVNNCSKTVKCKQCGSSLKYYRYAFQIILTAGRNHLKHHRMLMITQYYRSVHLKVVLVVKRVGNPFKSV